MWYEVSEIRSIVPFGVANASGVVLSVASVLRSLT